jgi:hypothetical protein
VVGSLHKIRGLQREYAVVVRHISSTVRANKTMKFFLPISILLVLSCCAISPNKTRYYYQDVFTIDVPSDWITVRDSSGFTIIHHNQNELIMGSSFINKNGNFEEFKNTAFVEAIDTSWQPISNEIRIANENKAYKLYKNKTAEKDSIVTIYHILSVVNKADNYLWLKIRIPRENYLRDSVKYIDIIKSIKLK